MQDLGTWVEGTCLLRYRDQRGFGAWPTWTRASTRRRAPETPLQFNIAAAEINSLDVLITEVLKNIEEEKFRAKIQPKPKQDGSLLGPLPSSVSDAGNNAPFGIED